jgi:hypothetical protein
MNESDNLRLVPEAQGLRDTSIIGSDPKAVRLNFRISSMEAETEKLQEQRDLLSIRAHEHYAAVSCSNSLQPDGFRGLVELKALLHD